MLYYKLTKEGMNLKGFYPTKCIGCTQFCKWNRRISIFESNDRQITGAERENLQIEEEKYYVQKLFALLSPDKFTLIDRGSKTILFSVKVQELLAQYDARYSPVADDDARLYDNDMYIGPRLMCFVAENDMLFLGLSNGIILKLSSLSLAVESSMKCHDSEISCLAWDQLSNTLAAGSINTKVCIYQYEQKFLL